MIVRFWLAAVALMGASAAQPVSVDYVRIDVPDGWVRNDESRFASFSPADDPDLVLIVAMRLGEDGADDRLEDFVEHVEGGETVVERKEVEEVSDDDFDVLSQETRTIKAGTHMRRLYLAADPEDHDTVIALSGTADSFARHETEGRAAVLGASFGAAPTLLPAAEQVGEGGLDGIFVATRNRPYLDGGSGRWADGPRTEIMIFDPLGEVYRGAPETFGPEIFDRCDGSAAWRCGRYRMEGGEIRLRWNDGTVDRRRFDPIAGQPAIDGVAWRQVASRPDMPNPGAYTYSDPFNVRDWPLNLPKTAGEPLRIRLLEDGRFLFEGFTSIRNPRFGKGLSASGRYKVDGPRMTLIYETGGIDVVGYARWQVDGADVLMIGGRIFRAGPA